MSHTVVHGHSARSGSKIIFGACKITDGLRSLILEYFGYSTKVFEFISEAHTPKNVMIVAEKKSKTDIQKQEILKKIEDTKKYFGIEFHYLEKLMNM